jgi:prophage antirepressor-like protein
MNSDVVVFSFESKNVRTLTIDGEVFFRASDVADAIGVHLHGLLARVPDDEISQTDLIDSMGRSQATKFLSEAGTYRAVLRSDKKEAEPFIRWVTREVLPSIRKQGYYVSETLKESLAEQEAELARKEQVILQLQGKKRKTPRVMAPNFNVFDGHDPKWELSDIESLGEPVRTLAVLRQTNAQIVGLKKRAQRLKEQLGIEET